MSRKRIDFGKGEVRDLANADLKQGTTAYMGASSAPDLVYIEEVGDDWVTIRNYPYYPEDKQKVRRDVAEDLIAQGNETVRESRRPNKYINRKTNLRVIQRVKLKVKINKDVSDGWSYLERTHNVDVSGARDGRYTVRTTKKKAGQLRDARDIRVVESKKVSG